MTDKILPLTVQLHRNFAELNLKELYMKRVFIEPTLKNQSNDAYTNPHFSIKMVTVPAYTFTPQTDKIKTLEHRKSIV